MIFAPAEIAFPSTITPDLGPYQGETYYEQPLLLPSHYGWLITAYFYAGGLASAGQFLSTVVDLFGREEDRPLVRSGRYLALLGALVSPPLLILDLQTPLRWYNMLRIFRRTSAMSIGSWALSAFGLLSGLAAVGQAMEDLTSWRLARWIARLAGLPAALAGGVVAIYTGTLLAATNVPLWASGFPSLSSLFASSAATTAAAALSLLTPRVAGPTRRRLAAFQVISGAAELFFAARIDRHWRAQQTGAPVQATALGATWRAGVLGLGILFPLGLHLLQLFGGKDTRHGESWTNLLASLAALTGGFLLRGVFIFGGNRSANRPRDYFRMTQPAPNGRKTT